MKLKKTYIEEQIVATGMYFVKEGEKIVDVAYSEEDAQKRLDVFRKKRADKAQLTPEEIIEEMENEQIGLN